MKTNSGILYSVSNELWKGFIKCGLTTQKLEKRISNLQTSLFCDCEIIAKTNLLINCQIYEYLLKKILFNHRIRKDREFYNISPEEIKEIFESFNYINSILDTEEKLNNYMWNNHREYYKNPKKRLYSEMCSSESNLSSSSGSNKKKLKRQRVLYVDTSEL
jgi:hypothetical protein